jgi:hypothetical protein
MTLLNDPQPLKMDRHCYTKIFSLLQCSFQEAFGAIICHYSRMENDHTETVYDPIE